MQRGEKLFASAGCAACHVPQLATAAHPRYPATLPAQTIAPYSDMLLHDMGADLADNRPDFKASGRQWRTQPLWGIGLIPVVNGHSQYLHDGRARNLEEAVVWHGGEANRARQRYAALPRDERQAALDRAEERARGTRLHEHSFRAAHQFHGRAILQSARQFMAFLGLVPSDSALARNTLIVS